MKLNLDDNLLMNSFFDNRIFNTKENEIWSGRLELIIRPECNQKCDYCYITRFGDELYPKEYRASNKELINNLKLLLDYFKKRKFICRYWDLFAGDLFYDDLYFDIIDVFFDYYKEYKNIDLQFQEVEIKSIRNKKKKFNKVPHPNQKFVITMPFNGSVFHDKEKTKKLQSYIDKAQEYDIRLGFSWSHDGPYSVDVREKRKIDNEFYETAFNFLVRNGYGAHPMISREGLNNIKENYLWWLEQCEKYYAPINENHIAKEYLPMFLEVRNEGWTKEEINKYVEFLEWALDHRFTTLCESSVEKMAYHIFTPHNLENLKRNKDKMPPALIGSDFLCLREDLPYFTEKKCTLGHSYSINLSKLTFVPCHRMAYQQFEGAKFIKKNKLLEEVLKIDNDYINNTFSSECLDGIEATQGYSAYLNMMNANIGFAPRCATCPYRMFCIKGCYGAQYECFGDWNIPIPEICDLLQAKYDCIIKKLFKYGVLDYVFNTSDFPVSTEFKQSLQFLSNYILNEKKENNHE